MANQTQDLRLRAWTAAQAEPFMYKGEWAETIRATREGLPVAYEIGDWMVVLFASAWAAIACVELKRIPEARGFVNAALEGVSGRPGLDYALGVPEMVAARVHLAEGEKENAMTTARAAVEPAERGGFLVERGAAYRVLGEVHAARCELPDAEAAFRRSLEVLRAIQSRPEFGQTLLAFGRFKMEADVDNGRHMIERALELFQSMGATAWAAQAHAAMDTGS